VATVGEEGGGVEGRGKHWPNDFAERDPIINLPRKR